MKQLRKFKKIKLYHSNKKSDFFSVTKNNCNNGTEKQKKYQNCYIERKLK